MEGRKRERDGGKEGGEGERSETVYQYKGWCLLRLSCPSPKIYNTQGDGG